MYIYTSIYLYIFTSNLKNNIYIYICIYVHICEYIYTCMNDSAHCACREAYAGVYTPQTTKDMNANLIQASC